VKSSIEQCVNKKNLRSSTTVLDIILTHLTVTPRDGYNVLIVEGRDEVVPLGHLDDARVVHLLGLVEHVALDGLEERGDRTLQVG
jgi:hypothetical protein